MEGREEREEERSSRCTITGSDTKAPRQILGWSTGVYSAQGSENVWDTPGQTALPTAFYQMGIFRWVLVKLFQPWNQLRLSLIHI